WRRQFHTQRVGLNANPEYPSPCIGSLGGAAAVRERREVPALTFPHHSSMPAKLATDIRRRQTDRFKPGHRQLPTPPSHPEASVARFALHVSIGGPIVAGIIDEAETQPNRVGKIQCGDRAGG